MRGCEDLRGAVFLVHGIDDTTVLFDRLRPILEAQGWATHAHNLTPNNGDAGIDELAAQVAHHVETSLNPGEPLDIVGFSMGGLVSRYYVQRLAGSRRIRRLVTVSAPHRGSWTAYLRDNRGARQMRPGSRFLEELNHDLQALRSVAFTSIWTPLDLMIVPANSSVLAGTKSVPVYVPAHALMMRDRRVLRLVEQALLP
jgi:triacylglycerol lipase